MSKELAVIQQVKNQTKSKLSSIMNGYNTSDVGTVAVAMPVNLCLSSLCGVLTANTLKTALSITGAGRLDFATVLTADTTSRTIRMKITMDDVVVFDPGMSATITAASAGIQGAGYIRSSTPYIGIPQYAYFSSSCLVEIASSLTETDKLTIYYSYQLY